MRASLAAQLWGEAMKRSGQVGLAVMGVAAFATTYASVSAYRASAHDGVAQTTCTTRADGTQSCEPVRRGFTYYLYPHFGSSSASASSAPTQSAALTGNARAYTSASPSGTARGGFGSFRVSAGG
jgi:hypothetical protein